MVLTYTLARRDIVALSISAHEATLELCCSDVGLHTTAVQMKTVQSCGICWETWVTKPILNQQGGGHATHEI